MKQSIILLLFISLIIAELSGQNQKLIASDAEEFDKFGWSIDLDDNYLIVGAPTKADFGGNSGAAYIFRFNGSEWVEEAKLTASDTLAYNEFGYSVSIEGDFAAVGARVNYTGVGAVYIFKRNGTVWEEEIKINCPDCGTQGQALFGRAVSLKEDRVLIGAQQSTQSLYEAGTAYIFKRENNNWILEETFIPADAAITAQFGWSVSLAGNYAIIGAVFDPLSFNNPMGAAYIYKLDGNNWIFDAKLLPDTLAPYQNFGFSVSINGNYAVAGAPGGGTNYGKRAIVFENEAGQWNRKAILLPYDYNVNFGRSVAIKGNDIIVGNTRYGAYLFRNTQPDWNLFAKIEPDDTTYTVNDFGESVSLSENFVSVGDPSGFNNSSLKTGSVHLFDKNLLVNVDENQFTQPEDFTLYQNYPNPFNPSTKISWQSPVGSHQTLKIYDMLGNEVATLVDEYREAGRYKVEFNSHSSNVRNLASGIYLYHLRAGDFVETKKMILLR